MNLNPEFHKYLKDIFFESVERECGRIIWPPSHLSVPHDHGISKGFFLVLKGSVFQIAYNPKAKRNKFSKKIVYTEGMVVYENPGIIHVVGNDSLLEDAITIHYYQPRLIMKEYNDMMQDFAIRAMGPAIKASPKNFIV